jgi:hypothetical protein
LVERLEAFIKESKSNRDYVKYCVSNLPKDDQELAKKFIAYPKLESEETRPQETTTSLLEGDEASNNNQLKT